MVGHFEINIQDRQTIAVNNMCVYPKVKKDNSNALKQNNERKSEGRAGSRRIFPPQFKLQVLEAYRRDATCRGNQRATARKFGIHRRQIQKWLQAEPALRAALLRRAPQAAPSPPPYSVGSPESARLPSPSPPMQEATAMPTVTASEPIDLSLRRACSPLGAATTTTQHHSSNPTTEPVQRKPFSLFRPYDLPDTPRQQHRHTTFTMIHCGPCDSWNIPSFAAPLR